MLVLTRRTGERIILKVPGVADITLEVADAWNGRAKLAIDAPLAVKIVREEHERKHGE